MPDPSKILAALEFPRARSALYGKALLLLAIPALVFWAGAANAQLSDNAPISTEGTQFVTPEKVAPTPRPKPPSRPRAARPRPPRRPVAPRAQKQTAPPPRYPSVVFLLDSSDSMLNPVPGKGHTRLDEAKTALKQVVGGMSRETRVQMWTFNTRLRQISIAGSAPKTFIQIGRRGMRARLVEQIGRIRTAGGTNLYKAIIRTLDIFADPADQPLYRSGQRFPVLVVISDGEDGGKTGHTLDAVLAARRRFPLVTINAIGFHLGGEQQWFRKLCRIATRPTGCAAAGDLAQLQTILEGFYRPSAAVRR